jgi:hypothetical protein
VAGFYPAHGPIGTSVWTVDGDNRAPSRHVYTHVVSAAFRSATAFLLFVAAFLSSSAVLGQRGGGGGLRPIDILPDGAGGGRAQIFRGRGDMPNGTAVIRGIVTSDTGIPVRRAQVRGSASGMPGGRVALTGADGRFELRDLPAGRWMVSASKPGFVTQRLGQRRPNETVPELQLADGQKVDGANFSLLRGGVITGRVQDDFGDPVAHARVTVQRRQMFEGARRLVPVGVTDETDDTGAFRLYGLAPGDYYVSARGRQNPLEQPGDTSGFAPTYYPGTGNVGEAQHVTVGAGEEASIAFSLLSVRLVRVSGTVVSQSGEVGGGNVQLISADGGGEGPLTALAGGIQNDGSFVISNVPTGSYVLNARSGIGGRGRGAAARAGAEVEIGSLPLVVGESDVTGVAVTLTRGASIAGTVVKEGTAPITLSNLRVMARPMRNTPGRNVAASGVSATGSFQLSTLSGTIALRVENLPSEWTLKSIVVGSADVTDGAFDLRGTEQITNARIVISDRVSELNGTVSLGNQEAKGSTVIVFADDAALWTFPTRYVRMVRSDAEGRFTLRGLPPGATYLAAAVDYLEEGEWQDPEFLERLREPASRVALREGETKTVALQLLAR